MSILMVGTMLVPSTPARAASVPALDHFFLIVMENHSFPEIIGSPSAPYINSLKSTGALGTGFHAVAHPSLPNYLVLTGGSSFGITSDCTTCWINAPNIGDRIESAGKTWKAYQEAMPSPCFIGDSYPYMQKHNPLVYFNDIRTNSARCQAHDVPYTQLATDLRSTSTTPNYAFITPDMCHDMHDCSIDTGDAWLQAQVPSILASPAFRTQRSVLAITWDEDDSSASNWIPLIMAGSGINRGTQSSLGYNHWSLLHTIEVALGTSTLTSTDAGATPMADFFASAPASPPCTSAALSANPASPGGTGIGVTLSGAAAGCANPVYRFWIKDPGRRWSMVQDYSSSSTYSWKQTGAAGGYSLEVDVRDASETSVYDAVSNLAYTVNGCSLASISPGSGGPQPHGTQVMLGGSASCPGTPTYRFWVRAAGGAWKIVRDYSTTSTFGWVPAAATTYYLEVDVRDQGGTDTYEAVSNTTFAAT